MKRLVLLAILCLASIGFGDSIDMAEAQKRGVPVERVQLERAQAKIADLQKQVADLQAQLADAKGPGQASTPQTSTPSPVADSLGMAPATVTPPAPVAVSNGGDPVDSKPKTVNVSGYTRKDGTYVAPYVRSAPTPKSK